MKTFIAWARRFGRPFPYLLHAHEIIDGAKKDGKLVIYSATDSKAAAPLVKDFSAL
jgi:iron(III) transport system substrate-binding protein